MCKISIIIPVYNVEKYLSRCIESIINQRYSDKEILLIDDGSTDRSGEICDEYAINYENIQTFHQENSGVSVARNCGINKASGEWICFVDADDWIEPNSIDKILITDSERIPNFIVAKSFSNSSEQAKVERYPFSNNLLNKYHKGTELIIRSIYMRGSVCGVIFNRQFLISKNIFFPQDIKNGEDSIFYMLCSIYAERVVFSNTHLYNVYERVTSASRGNWTFSRVFNMTNNINYLNQYLESHNNLSLEAINILNFAKYGTLSNMYNKFKNSFSIKNYLILRREIKPKLKEKINTGLIKTNKLKVKILNFSLDIFAILILLKKN